MVSFNTQGGSAAANNSYTVESRTISLPAAPTRAGYSFNGWFLAASGGTSIGSGGSSYTFTGTGNITIHAQWTIITYTVSYDVQGGSTPIANSSYTIGTNVSLPSPGTRASFIFSGWFTSATGGTRVGCTGDTYPCTFSPTGVGNVILYAQWTGSTVAMPINSGIPETTPTSQTVNIGSQFTLPTAPSRPGYTFTGWFQGDSASNRLGSGGESVSVSPQLGAEGIRARWSVISYAVIVDSQGGQTLTSRYGSRSWSDTARSINLPGEPNSRSGFTFNGWFLATTGGTDLRNLGGTYTVTQATGDLTIYARWTALPPPVPTKSVRFANGSTNQTVVYYQETGPSRTIVCPSVAGPAPVAGWIFTGWHAMISSSQGSVSTGSGPQVCAPGQSWTVQMGPIGRPFPPSVLGAVASGSTANFKDQLLYARWVRP